MRIQNIKRFWNCYRVLQKIAKNWKWHEKTRFFDISHYAVTLNYTVTWKRQDFEWMRLKIQKMTLKIQLSTIKIRHDFNSFPVDEDEEEWSDEEEATEVVTPERTRCLHCSQPHSLCFNVQLGGYCKDTACSLFCPRRALASKISLTCQK